MHFQNLSPEFVFPSQKNVESCLTLFSHSFIYFGSLLSFPFVYFYFSFNSFSHSSPILPWSLILTNLALNLNPSPQNLTPSKPKQLSQHTYTHTLTRPTCPCRTHVHAYTQSHGYSWLRERGMNPNQSR